jgi:hypothetical protein
VRFSAALQVDNYAGLWKKRTAFYKKWWEFVSEQFHRGLQGGCHLVEVISPLIEIEQPGTKQAASQ